MKINTKSQHFYKLNSRGLSHLIVPLFVVLAIAIGGTYFVVAGHACNEAGKPVGYCGDATTGSTRPVNGSSGSSTRPVGAGSERRSTDRGHRGRNTSPGTGSTPQSPPGSGKTGSDTSSDGGPAQTQGSETGTIRIQNPTSSKASFTPKPKPSGDIVVLTYVDDPEIDKKGDKDHRIGNIKVKVQKVDGPNNCDNTKKNTGTTNQTKTITPKGETKPVFLHGTVHFLNCDAGKYTATIVKIRKGYEAASPTTRTFTLNDNETEAPFFVVKKKATK